MNALQNSAELDNLLVDQKNSILLALGTGQDVEDIEKAINLLLFAQPLWDALGYSYKVREIKSRIRGSIDEAIAACEDYLNNCRKNDKCRGSFMNDVQKLTKLQEIL